MSTFSANINLTDVRDQVVEIVKNVVIQSNVRNKNTGKVVSKHGEISGDVVTDTDFELQKLLQNSLFQLAPDALFLGEENYTLETDFTDKLFWIVDPLDGTLNYASGLPFYSVSVALVANGSPIIGVIYDIEHDVVFDAIKDGGARENNVLMHWDANLASKAPVGASSGYIARMLEKQKAQKAANPIDIGSRYRIFGSQAVQLCWAAKGALKLNINVEAKLWDDVAGSLICLEAGANYMSVTTEKLYPLNPTSGAAQGGNLFSVAGDPQLTNEFIDEIRSNL